MKTRILTLLTITITFGAFAQKGFEKQIRDIEKKVIEWRHHFHENPELSNREFKTAEKIAAHLKDLGMEVQTGVAKTGVVGHIEGSSGPTVGLRADMDALPILEENGTDFDSLVS